MFLAFESGVSKTDYFITLKKMFLINLQLEVLGEIKNTQTIVGFFL